MAEQWYAPDPNAQLEAGPAQHRERDAGDATFVELLKAWAMRDDPRRPNAAYILLEYPDGFAVRYVGGAHISEAELVLRVVFIADSMRQASR